MKAVKGMPDLKALLSSKRIKPLGAALVVIAAFYGYKYHMSLQHGIGERMREYANAVAVMEEGAAPSGREKELIARLDGLEKGLLKASSPARAAALLEGAFREAASKRSVDIVSKRRLPAVPDSAYTKVPVEFQVRGKTGAIKDLLYDIYASEEIVGVSSVRLRHLNDGGALDAVLVVDGAIKTNGANDATATD